MADFNLNASLVNKSIDSNITESFINAYISLDKSEKRLLSIQDNIKLIIEEDIDVCDMNSVVDKLNSILSQVEDLKSGMVKDLSEILSGGYSGNGLEIGIGLEKYEATQIILKKYQILKLRIDKCGIYIEKVSADFLKKIFLLMLKGYGNTGNSIVEIVFVALKNIANIINKLAESIDKISDIMASNDIIGLKGGECEFFMTPKSMKNTKIKIKNPRESVNHFIPDEIQEKIEKGIDDITGKIIYNKKISDIGKLQEEGRDSAVEGFFNSSDIHSIEKFNPEKIKELIKSIMIPLNTVAEALPRYEDLTQLNTRFYIFLDEFTKSGHKSFGFPGFP